MIIGNGLLARSFALEFSTDPDIVVFASGVSNSSESRASEFARERALLDRALDQRRLLVYFGSCGVATAEQDPSPYMQHKQEMEARVLDSGHGLVLRLPQVVGSTSNPHTLINFMRDRILSGQSFTVWSKAQRNLIDVDDIAAIGGRLIRGHRIAPKPISVAAPQSLTVIEIVGLMERILGRKAHYVVEDRGAPLRIDADEACAAAADLGIDMGPGYAERILRKYYAP
ncbi:NAD-dependent epimerase/dehydratase family protein [Luteimonas gilva]|uniref:NAD-dependent epimerase/dehydratase family protein n=1 Tax=Luteimonas gilva TaxID=2572684 RepID=A0A4U5JLW5_9GAMM|nr:NAD-dependent epimerase/dehydratase family protein [Luteimonas gilva]TKR29726.1 NAD-dependent epimerase/dehydratase family protein [Luteimonas gilva]